MPVNSKNAEARMRQRLLLSLTKGAKAPPLGPEIEDPATLSAAAAALRQAQEPKLIGASSITPSPAARITGAISLIRTSSARRRSSSLCRGKIVTETDSSARVLRPGDVLFVVVAVRVRKARLPRRTGNASIAFR